MEENSPPSYCFGRRSAPPLLDRDDLTVEDPPILKKFNYLLPGHYLLKKLIEEKIEVQVAI